MINNYVLLGGFLVGGVVLAVLFSWNKREYSGDSRFGKVPRRKIVLIRDGDITDEPKRWVLKSYDKGKIPVFDVWLRCGHVLKNVVDKDFSCVNRVVSIFGVDPVIFVYNKKSEVKKK